MPRSPPNCLKVFERSIGMNKKRLFVGAKCAGSYYGNQACTARDRYSKCARMYGEEAQASVIEEIMIPLAGQAQEIV